MYPAGYNLFCKFCLAGMILKFSIDAICVEESYGNNKTVLEPYTTTLKIIRIISTIIKKKESERTPSLVHHIINFRY